MENNLEIPLLNRTILIEYRNNLTQTRTLESNMTMTESSELSKLEEVERLIKYTEDSHNPVYNPYSISIMIKKGTQELEFFINSLWFIINSITTVAYGDAFPKTHLGRAVTSFTCIFGIFLLSLITASLSTYTEFSSEEVKAYCIIKQIKQENKKRLYTGYMIF